MAGPARTRVRAARRRRRDRHESRALRAGRRTPPPMARGRSRRVVCLGRASAGRRSRSCRTSAIWSRSAKTSPASCSPTRMRTITARSRSLAEAEGAGLCDAVHRGAARGQARGRAGRAGNPGHQSCRSASRFTVGPFDIELVSMAHSIPESNALIIRTRHGTVLHTGDWKIDPTPVIGADRRDTSCARSATRAASRSSAIPPMRCARAARRRKPMSPRPSPS